MFFFFVQLQEKKKRKKKKEEEEAIAEKVHERSRHKLGSCDLISERAVRKWKRQRK